MKTLSLKFNIIFRFVAFIFLCTGVKYRIYATAPVDSMYLVWSDEFDGETLDTHFWTADVRPEQFDYSTDRPENILLYNGYLFLTTRKENYLDREFTSGVIRTFEKISWKYGRIEARVKLPVANDLTAAFWLAYENGNYGWWPTSGEIDVFEVFTQNVNKIYGNIGTEKYNHIYSDEISQGIIEIENADSEFHLYAIDWNSDSIAFSVDDSKYFVFHNDHSGYENWPFDQPFHIILSMICGPGFSPDSASMLADYVRIYQKLDDTNICGNQHALYNTIETYQGPVIDGATYNWRAPADAQILSGQGTDQIIVQWYDEGGDIELALTKDEYTTNKKYRVTVNRNLIRNGDFTNDIKFWFNSKQNPWAARFFLEEEPIPIEGKFIKAEISEIGELHYYISLGQTNVILPENGDYEGSFWARAENEGDEIDVIYVNSEEPYNMLLAKHYILTETWDEYHFSFSTTKGYIGIFKFDIGYQTGILYFDKISLMKVDVDDIEADFGSSPSGSFFRLDQNYPNPFNTVTTVKYHLPKDCHVALKICNALGQEISTFVDRQQKAGYYTIQWEAIDHSSGVYFILMKTNDFVKVRKILLMR